MLRHSTWIAALFSALMAAVFVLQTVFGFTDGFLNSSGAWDYVLGGMLPWLGRSVFFLCLARFLQLLENH